MGVEAVGVADLVRAARMLRFVLIPIDRLVLMPFASRLEASDVDIAELEASIREHGVLEPLVVRPLSDDNFEVTCGSRRFKASLKVGLKELPCIIRNMSDEEAWECSFIENEHRSGLSDYERGRWLKEMLTRFPKKYPNQQALASKLVKSQSYVSQLLQHFEGIEAHKKSLSGNIITRVITLPEGVTREIHKAPPGVQSRLLEAAAENSLSTRETRQLVESVTGPETVSVTAVKELQTETREKQVERQAKEDSLFTKLSRYYPSSFLDEVAKRIDTTSEEKLVKTLVTVLDVAWDKLINQGLVDAVFEDAKKWS